MNVKISNRSMFLLWFGAAVSMAEIMTGALYAPMGFKKGVLAILLGHILGNTFLVLTGIIGFRERASSMESTRYTFGVYGSYLFSLLNILQLIGWTAVMIIVAGRSMNTISIKLWGFDNFYVWAMITGFLVILWLYSGNRGFNEINNTAVVLLFVLTIVMSFLVFRGGIPAKVSGGMSFGQGFELAVVMPLSWLPLVSDYTRAAESEKGSAIATWFGYFIGSAWMYIIGLGTALAFKSSDPTEIMLKAGLGIYALLIVVMSTVTTTFLDVYSSAMSFLNIKKGDEKLVSVIMGAIGTIVALVFPMEQYENFLYAIGSVFAPLFAVLVIGYFIFKEDKSKQLFNVKALVSWGIGVVLYYVLLRYNTVIGVTLPDVILTGIVYLIAHKIGIAFGRQAS
ncbi:putative hydroxymethylpyrimidine transporter CytX [Caldanaerobius fijiensis DSM 17918]|uniref:Putative hydroxymethylpyrimidine transporter CytX n=1 Tax=Caldanaerobius fijiensis DSM 17918 TaxID=1121256 RepID=A0A1M4Y2I4_9THEO|nr:putative hydroxymethylpyrimidine transporter CytX [Caldanaerobius fijiensis]SHE99915.1 putative hydroxymethylpyrimidine transporter CytX [Caldanaerobius fijiensis DSM 17918]